MFAEYDIIRDSPALFEQTPSTAAFNNGAKCFFVGRRGTGKKALTYFIKTAVRNAIDIHPQVMSPLGLSLHAEDYIAAGGFWEAMRHRYNATSVIWECKNYAVLSADDFH